MAAPEYVPMAREHEGYAEREALKIGSVGTYFGNEQNMPMDLSKALMHRRGERVLYWSAPDRELPIGRFVCCTMAGPLFVLPCFWPHLIVLGAPLACCSYVRKQDIMASYLVLTESTVESVQVEHDRCCISGCYIKGTEVSSIPLETVVDVQTDAQNKGCLTKCAPYVSEIKIVTPGAVITQNRAIAGGTAFWGHQNIQEVRSLLLDQREVIKQKRGGGGGYGNAGAAGMVVAAEVVEKSPMAVLTELRALLDAGLITSEDYETKKKNVVAAMR